MVEKVRWGVGRRIQNARYIVAALLVLGLPASGQIKIGDNLSLTGNGTMSASYTGTTGNQTLSSHGLGFGGAFGLAGFYYNPNFLSFNIDPYYNQSRSNSSFGSVTNASGVSLSSAIFSGSHFPGSVNYTTTYDSTGNYGIPGIASLDTNGNSQGFGVTWSALLPDYPTLTVGYQQGSNNYSLYGANQDGNSRFRSLFVNSTYNFHGFGLGGGVSHGSSDALIPGVIVGDNQEARSNSVNTSYNFNVSHQLPLSGTWNASFNRTDLNSDYLGYTFNGVIDRVSTAVGLNPSPKLHFSAGADYTDNLSGSLYQAIIPGASGNNSGSSTNLSSSNTGAIEATAQEQTSHAMNFLFNTTYAFAPNLQLQGQYERRMQTYSGLDYGSNLYSAGVYYTRQIMGGYLGSSVSIADGTVDGSSQNQLGFTASTNYNRRIGAWQIGGFFNYAQNVQTVLVTYTTSFYNFSGNVSRKFGRLFWNANASFGRSGLTAQPGTSSDSQSFGTSIGTSRLNISGNYAKSNGNSLAGGGGLIPTPLPPIIPPSLLVLYGGTSYSATISGAPMRHLTASASYAKSKNNLTNQGIFSWNNYETENVFVQYQFRQIGLQGGYTRLVQGFSASGLPPARVSSFSIGVYRWFNFF